MTKFDEFKLKEKYEEDHQIFYPGVADPGLRKILTERINSAADDFNEVSLRSGSIADDYREVIKKGFERFDEIYLDTEDRERVCHYFEELNKVSPCALWRQKRDDFTYFQLFQVTLAYQPKCYTGLPFNCVSKRKLRNIKPGDPWPHTPSA